MISIWYVVNMYGFPASVFGMLSSTGKWRNWALWRMLFCRYCRHALTALLSPASSNGTPFCTCSCTSTCSCMSSVFCGIVSEDDNMQCSFIVNSFIHIPLHKTMPVNIPINSIKYIQWMGNGHTLPLSSTMIMLYGNPWMSLGTGAPGDMATMCIMPTCTLSSSASSCEVQGTFILLYAFAYKTIIMMIMIAVTSVPHNLMHCY